MAYGLIEGVLRDLLEDGRLSAAAAHEREAALGKLEREKVAVDSDGRVDGIPLDVLATSSVRALCVEFAEDVYLAPIEMDFRLAHSAQGTRISSVTGASRYLDWGLLAILYGSAEQARSLSGDCATNSTKWSGSRD